MEARPIDLKIVDSLTKNLYEAVIVAARRARQIGEENRLEYNTIINSIIPGPEDEFDERANPEMLKIALEFEKRDKPHQIALSELMGDGIGYRYKDDE
jgi:DNA-directed RNA polymerase subunit K/omega